MPLNLRKFNGTGKLNEIGENLEKFDEEIDKNVEKPDYSRLR